MVTQEDKRKLERIMGLLMDARARTEKAQELLERFIKEKIR